jgi:methylase of polypeptide subunit release factors
MQTKRTQLKGTRLQRSLDRTKPRYELTSVYNTVPAETLLERHARATYPFSCRFGRAMLEIVEGVFCPTFTRVAPLLLEALAELDFGSGRRVLDVFAGSGAFGINAALHGANVVTVDISPVAVECTRRNAASNNVAHRIDARVGTMRQRVASGEVFDLVVANPPLLSGKPNDPLAAALFDPQLAATCDLIARLPRHLTDNGECFLVSSSHVDLLGTSIDQLCAASGLNCATRLLLDAGYETYRVHRISRLHCS